MDPKASSNALNKREPLRLRVRPWKLKSWPIKRLVDFFPPSERTLALGKRRTERALGRLRAKLRRRRRRLRDGVRVRLRLAASRCFSGI